jgi:hypothetical protein
VAGGPVRRDAGVRWVVLGVGAVMLGGVLWVLSTYPLAALGILMVTVLVLAGVLFRGPRETS